MNDDEVDRKLREMHTALVEDLAEILDLDVGLAEIVGDPPERTP